MEKTGTPLCKWFFPPHHSCDLLHSLNKAKQQTMKRLNATSHTSFLAIIIVTLSSASILWYIVYPLTGCQLLETSTYIRVSTHKPFSLTGEKEHFSLQVECTYKYPPAFSVLHHLCGRRKPNRISTPSACFRKLKSSYNPERKCLRTDWLLFKYSLDSHYYVTFAAQQSSVIHLLIIFFLIREILQTYRKH